MTATPTLEDIEAFEQAHGFASFDRCRIAERRTRIARRSLGDGRITPSMLMRQGLPSVLAEAYCLLLYGRTRSPPLLWRSSARNLPSDMRVALPGRF
jgi:hypothetical protein